MDLFKCAAAVAAARVSNWQPVYAADIDKLLPHCVDAQLREIHPTTGRQLVLKDRT